MNNIIIYRPSKSQNWAIILAFFIAVFWFCVAGLYLTISVFITCILLVAGVMSIWLSAFLYNVGNICIFFENDGLRIAGGSYKNYSYIPWGNFKYAYYTKNFRNFSFLVLSPKELSLKEARNYANKGANSSKICLDDIAVIYLDDSQNISQEIKEFITEKIDGEGDRGDGSVVPLL